MKYMLMMNVPGGGEYQVDGWQPAEISAHMGFMRDLNAGLAAAGEWVDGQGLAAPNQARIVTRDSDGAPVVTDGPFPEAKEFLAGYWIVDCDSVERVYEIAATISGAPGPGGSPLVIPVEVRQVMGGAPPDDL